MRRPVAVAVLVLALVAGGGAAWARDLHTGATAAAQSRDRVAAAVVAGEHDEQSAAGLADRSSGLVAQGLLDDSARALAWAIPGAQAVLDASAGKVADDTVRQQLAAVIAQAQGAVVVAVAPVRADQLTARLSSASTAVSAAEQAWQADQAAKAAATAARASARPSVAATPTPVDSCTTTYNGPPFYTSVPQVSGSGANGDIPASAMTELTWAGKDQKGSGYWLLAGAAAALTRLDVAFQAQFGQHLDIDLAYRNLETQREMYAALGPQVAATPGTSHHGLGTAIDVPEWPCEYGRSTPERDWLVVHGPAYGWYPDPNEYWHFDYRG